MQTLEMAESLSSISFRDEPFLMREPLSPSNILEYFYASQFYSLTGGAKSINEMIRRGSIAPEAAGRIDGELYMLVSANKDAEAGMTDMSVFVQLAGPALGGGTSGYGSIQAGQFTLYNLELQESA